MPEPVVVRRPTGDRPPEAHLYYGHDCREALRELPSSSVHCVVTSPPYWGLRAYDSEPSVWGGDAACPHRWEDASVVRKGSTNGREDLGSTLVSAGAEKTLGPGLENDHGETEQYRVDRSESCTLCGAWRGHLGLEPTPWMYVEHIIEVFREVWRVLRDDGTLWLNLGDSYTANRVKQVSPTKWKNLPQGQSSRVPEGLRPKNLVMIPHRVAIALQEDGWNVRSNIVWSKGNPMPEAVKDRPTTSHEYIFLLTKNPHDYYYDHVAIMEPWADERMGAAGGNNWETPERLSIGGKRRPQEAPNQPGRNRRSVWPINTKPYPGAHFAVFPPELPRLCIQAGTSLGCCSSCGSPWRRVVEKGPPAPEPAHRDPGKRLEIGQPGNVGAGNMGFRASKLSGKEINAWKARHPDKTVGWEPTCSCSPHDMTPCTVLDPFSGSGTTGFVALREARDYIGIDASATYLGLATARIRDQEPLGMADVADDGGGLFDFLSVANPSDDAPPDPTLE